MPVTTELSARQVMEEVVTRSALAGIHQLKLGNKGNENLILRDMKAIHGYTATEDLPEHLQVELKKLVEAMFKYINSKGFVLVPKDSVKR